MGSPAGPHWDARVVAVATIWIFFATLVALLVMPAWAAAPRAWIVFALLGPPAWLAGELAAGRFFGGARSPGPKLLAGWARGRPR